MIPHPLDRYKLARAHQEQLWNNATIDQLAKDAVAKKLPGTEHLFRRVEIVRQMLALVMKMLRKAWPALMDSHIPPPPQEHARDCVKSPASMSSPPCVAASSHAHLLVHHDIPQHMEKRLHAL